MNEFLHRIKQDIKFNLWVIITCPNFKKTIIKKESL